MIYSDHTVNPLELLFSFSLVWGGVFFPLFWQLQQCPWLWSILKFRAALSLDSTYSHVNDKLHALCFLANIQTSIRILELKTRKYSFG